MQAICTKSENGSQVFYEDSDAVEDDTFAVDISSVSQGAHNVIEGTITRQSGEESVSDDDNGDGNDGNDDDEVDHGRSEEYESLVESGDDDEDQGPSVPPKRRKFNRVYFIED